MAHPAPVKLCSANSRCVDDSAHMLVYFFAFVRKSPAIAGLFHHCMKRFDYC
jgi:hypothetical protein